MSMMCSSSRFSVRMKAAFSSDKKVQRTAEKCDMSADGLTAGKTADGLIDNCLENGSRKVFFGRAVID